MPNPNRKRYNPGDPLDLFTVADYARLAEEVEALVRPPVVAPLEYTNDAIHANLPEGFYARLGGPASPYNFTEVSGRSAGAWANRVRTGTANAYEVNAQPGLDGKVIWLEPGAPGEYVGQWIAVGNPCGYYGCPIVLVCPHSYTISASFVTATFSSILGPGSPDGLGGTFVAGSPPRSPATGPITTLMTAGTFGGVPAWLSPAISLGVADGSGQTVFAQVISRPNCFAGYCPFVRFWYDAAGTIAAPYGWAWTGGGPTSGVDADGNLFCSGLSGDTGGITFVGLTIAAADWHPT